MSRPFVVDRNIRHFVWYGGVAGEGLRSDGEEALPLSKSGCSILPLVRRLQAGVLRGPGLYTVPGRALGDPSGAWPSLCALSALRGTSGGANITTPVGRAHFDDTATSPVRGPPASLIRPEPRSGNVACELRPLSCSPPSRCPKPSSVPAFGARTQANNARRYGYPSSGAPRPIGVGLC